VTLEEAGQSLGASPLRSFPLITLPNIWPGLVSGWLFAFVASCGELNTALFLTGPGVVTLPIEVLSYLQFQGSQLVVGGRLDAAGGGGHPDPDARRSVDLYADRRGALIDMQRLTTRLCGTFGAISSTHWLGTAVGVAVLERAGNAVSLT